MTYVALLLDNLLGDLLLGEEVLRQLIGVPPLVVLAVLCASWPCTGSDALAALLYEDLLVDLAVVERSLRGPPRAASCVAEA